MYILQVVRTYICSSIVGEGQTLKKQERKQKQGIYEYTP